MNRLPGLNVAAGEPKQNMASAFLDTLYLSGGLYLSQICSMTGLAPYEVQNWVRRGFLTPPVHKKYSRDQFCRIVLINLLRQSLKIDTISKLLAHINGHLNDESDDLIRDSGLYNYYVNTVLALEEDAAGSGSVPDDGRLRSVIDRITRSYSEPVPGSRNRLIDVLTVMFYAGSASRLQEKCGETISSWNDPDFSGS